MRTQRQLTPVSGRRYLNKKERQIRDRRTANRQRSLKLKLKRRDKKIKRLQGSIEALTAEDHEDIAEMMDEVSEEAEGKLASEFAAMTPFARSLWAVRLPPPSRGPQSPAPPVPHAPALQIGKPRSMEGR